MKLNKILFLLLLIGGLSSCDDLTELNVDKKNPEVVSSASLFSNAQKSIVDQMVSINVNRNTFRFFAEQLASTQYPEESNFVLEQRDVNGNLWNELYVDVIGNLRETKTVNDTELNYSDSQKTSQDAMCDVLEVYAWHVLVDAFGYVPYTGAFTDELTPTYDDGKFVYDEIITKLNGAIANLGTDSGYGSADLVYGGDMDSWKAFANSLKLRLAIRIADADAGKAATMAKEAASAGVITSNLQNFSLSYLGGPPNTNPLWVDLVQSKRTDFIASNTIIDYMNTLEDPRRSSFFDENLGAGVFTGGIFGDANSYADFTHINNAIKDPTFPGVLMSAAEVHFLLADAAQRGFDVGGTASGHYEAGVKSSFDEWGLTTSEAEAYLLTPAVAYDAADWKNKIGMQKWLALFNRGFEAYASYRMYDAPMMNIAVGAERTPPNRWTFPVSEYSLNEKNVKAAASSMGGDNFDVKVFWDKN